MALTPEEFARRRRVFREIRRYVERRLEARRQLRALARWARNGHSQPKPRPE